VTVAEDELNMHSATIYDDDQDEESHQLYTVERHNEDDIEDYND
jgi:hypothetical protein